MENERNRIQLTIANLKDLPFFIFAEHYIYPVPEILK